MTAIQDKINKAVERYRAFEPEEGYFLAFSGGKDSQAIYHLAKRAGVKFDAHYSLTSVDPPELIHFIKEQYPDVSIDIPRYPDGRQITMWNLIEKVQFPPTRLMRYCCEQLKECAGKERVTVTGVRWAESPRRKNAHDVVTIKGKPKTTRAMADAAGIEYRVNKVGALVLNDDNDETRRMVEQCYRTRKTLLNPIVDWTDEDVWTYLNDVEKVPHCKLYDKEWGGEKRIGCIGCPLCNEKARLYEFERWPTYKVAYTHAFDRMLKARKDAGKPTKWKTGEEVMENWLPY